MKSYLLFLLLSLVLSSRLKTLPPKSERVQSMYKHLKKTFKTPFPFDTYDEIPSMKVSNFKSFALTWNDIQTYYHGQTEPLNYFLKYRQVVLKHFLEKTLSFKDVRKYTLNPKGRSDKQEEFEFYSKNRINSPMKDDDYHVTKNFIGMSEINKLITISIVFNNGTTANYKGIYKFNNVGSTSVTSDIDLNVEFELENENVKKNQTNATKLLNSTEKSHKKDNETNDDEYIKPPEVLREENLLKRHAVYLFISLFNFKFEKFFENTSAAVLDVNLYAQVLTPQILTTYFRTTNINGTQYYPTEESKEKREAYVHSAKTLLGSIVNTESFPLFKEKIIKELGENNIKSDPFFNDYTQKLNEKIIAEHNYYSQHNQFYQKCLALALSVDLPIPIETIKNLHRDSDEAVRNQQMKAILKKNRLLTDDFDSVCTLLGTDYYALEAYLSLEDIMDMTSLQMGSDSPLSPNIKTSINTVRDTMDDASIDNSMLQNFAYGVMSLVHHGDDGKAKLVKYFSRMLLKYKKNRSYNKCWSDELSKTFLVSNRKAKLKSSNIYIVKEGKYSIATLNALREKMKKDIKDASIKELKAGLMGLFKCAIETFAK